MRRRFTAALILLVASVGLVFGGTLQAQASHTQDLLTVCAMPGGSGSTAMQTNLTYSTSHASSKINFIQLSQNTNRWVDWTLKFVRNGQVVASWFGTMEPGGFENPITSIASYGWTHKDASPYLVFHAYATGGANRITHSTHYPGATGCLLY